MVSVAGAPIPTTLAGICLRTLQLMIAVALVSASRSQISFAPLLRLNVHRQEPCRNYKYFSSFRPLRVRGVCAGVCVGVCVGARGRVCAEGCARGVAGAALGTHGVCVEGCVRGARAVCAGCARGVRGGGRGVRGVCAVCAWGCAPGCARGVCAGGVREVWARGVSSMRAGVRGVCAEVCAGVRGDLRGVCARYPRKGASHVLHTEVSAVSRCPLPTAFSAGRSQHYP